MVFSLLSDILNKPNKKRMLLFTFLISKIFLVYFWGFVGTSLVESFQNPTSLITVVVMMIIAYLMSFVIKKVFKIN